MLAGVTRGHWCGAGPGRRHAFDGGNLRRRTRCGRAVVSLDGAAIGARCRVVAVGIHVSVVGLESGTRLRGARAAPTTGRASAIVHATGSVVDSQRARPYEACPMFLWGFSRERAALHTAVPGALGARHEATHPVLPAFVLLSTTSRQHGRHTCFRRLLSAIRAAPRQPCGAAHPIRSGSRAQRRATTNFTSPGDFRNYPGRELCLNGNEKTGLRVRKGGFDPGK